jgi:hypothetical protein
MRIEMKIDRNPFFEPNITLTRFKVELSVSRIRIVALQEKCTSKSSSDLLKFFFLLI